MKKFYFLSLFLCVFVVNAHSQSVGKIFGKSEADILFGKAQASVNLEKDILIELNKKTNDGLMFRIFDTEVVILDGKRNIMYPDKRVIADDVVFYYLSKDMISNLLSVSKDNIVNIEMRESTLTITYGEETLENTMLCPPFCPVIVKGDFANNSK